MTVTLNFTDPKMGLRHPFEKTAFNEVLHIVYRPKSDLVLAQKIKIKLPILATAVRVTMTAGGGWKGFTDGNKVPQQHVLGWARRNVVIDMAFIRWAFAEFHAKYGTKVKIPSGQNTEDGYWGAVMIYSYFEAVWDDWLMMKAAGAMVGNVKI